MPNPPLLVFADDWQKHPSSCQHLIRHLLDSHQVMWVNTIGTRKPGLDLATLRRASGKLARWAGSPPSSPAPANPTVLDPRMWPWFGSRLSRSINRRLLARALSPAIARLAEPPVAVTTILGAGINADDTEWEQMWPTVLYAPVPGKDGAAIGLLVMGCRSMHWYDESDVDFVAALAASLTECVSKAMDPLLGLTHDERMAAYLMAEGLSDPEVARALKTDRERALLLMGGVLKKLNLRSRAELAALLGVRRDSNPATA